MGCGASTTASGGVATAPHQPAEQPVQQAPAAPVVLATSQDAPAEQAPAALAPADGPSNGAVKQEEAHHEAPAPHHEAPAPRHEAPAPHHEAPAPHHEAPAPHHEAPAPQQEAPATHHEAPVAHHEAPVAPAPAPPAPAARPTGAFPTAKSAKTVDWAPIKAKLPWDQSEESKAARKTLFAQFDINRSGQLSLGEVDKAIRDVLQIDELFDAKPVILRAYNHVKGLDGDDSVSFSEFRLLLQFLFHFFVIWEFFCSLDQDGDESRISAAEFKAAVPALKSLGVEFADADAEFVQLAKGSDHILFGDFADYALRHNLQHVIVNDE